MIRGAEYRSDEVGIIEVRVVTSMHPVMPIRLIVREESLRTIG
jgi:hypothetical protein